MGASGRHGRLSRLHAQSPHRCELFGVRTQIVGRARCHLPQFATHNAYTLAAIYEFGKDKDFEFQCLHGMGETLYDQVVGAQNLGRRVRIYAPVGTHETLLAYLVRRLLENGANSSFVNQIVDEHVSVDSLLKCPLDVVEQNTLGKPNAVLPLPRHLYGKQRLNSQGFDLSNENVLHDLQNAMNLASKRHTMRFLWFQAA